MLASLPARALHRLTIRAMLALGLWAAGEPAGVLAAPATVTVRAGDTLWSIARRVGTTVPRLEALNDLSSDLLKPGQVLRTAAPAPARPSATAATGKVVIRAGDTLGLLARRYGTSVAALRAVNGLKNDTIRAGAVLKLPAVGGTGATPSRAAALPPAGAGSGLAWPVNGPVTDFFGQHPYVRVTGSTFHTGVDIGVPVGTLVRAAAAGRVIYAGWNDSGYGNLVVVRGADGRDYYYGHNSRLLVSVGKAVARGVPLSLSGATGAVTGPHLHFEVRVNNVAVNPAPLLPSSRLSFAAYRAP